MRTLIRNILALVAGISTCLLLNGLLLGLLLELIPAPPGFDPATPSTFKLLEAWHFSAPFLAHAVPSLVGGLVAALLAATHRSSMALVVGGVHLIGGIAAACLIPAPAWFITLDLVLAYLPMAWMGGRLAMARK